MLTAKIMNQSLPQTVFAVLPIIQTTERGSTPKWVLILFSTLI
jgi:hypothetical protein